MATVQEMLDRLASGQASLDEVAADFRGRSWPAAADATDAQVWGTADGDAPGLDGWDTVDSDSRLTPVQYQALAAAHAAAVS